MTDTSPAMTDTARYQEMFAAVQAGKITEQEWFDYCQGVLADLLDQHKDVLVRLKYR